MANLAESIQKARQAGYSDADIAAYIAKDRSMGSKVKEARQQGYSDADIVGHLASPSLVEKAKDFAGNFIGGAGKQWAQIGDVVSPVSQFAGTLSAAANVGSGVNDLLHGRQPNVSNPFSPGKSGPLTAQANRLAPKAQTAWGEAGNTAGSMTPALAAPGTLGQRLANTFIPAATTELAGQTARKMGAGPKTEAAARIAGGLGGSLVASVRPSNPFAAADPVDRVGRQDPAAMTAQAQQFRDAGINPTLTDVVNDSGRGMIRAAGNMQTPGRDVANQFAAGRALDLPDRIGKQARNIISSDPRTPDEIRAATAATRSKNADNAFSAVRGDTLQMAPETVQALRTDYGRQAISEAAARERDPEVGAALRRLAGDALDAPSTPITVGMADRISRVLNGRSQAAARTGDNDLATTLGGLADSIRNPAKAASPGYAKALEGYGADSRLQQAAGVGEDMLKRNTDEFAVAAKGLAPEERPLALAGARRAVERAAGENVGSAPGVALRLANAPEQQARNAALLGPERANLFQNNMRLEAKAVDNAAAISPRRGSSTFLNASDDAAAKLQGVARVGKQIMRQDWLGMGMDWLKTRGLNDQDAESLVRMATDPTQTDRAIQIIQNRLGRDAAQEFISLRNAGRIGAAAGATALQTAPSADPQR